MLNFKLHHVSVPTRDLDRSAAFYEKVLRLERMPRPPFTVPGIWYAVGRNHIHVTVHAGGHFRDGKGVDNDDIHFALQVNDFEGAYNHFRSCGYDEALPQDHAQRMIVKRQGLAGFPQIFLMDPDRNVIEVNTAAFLND